MLNAERSVLSVIKNRTSKMVVTDPDIDNMPPEERKKAIAEIRAKKEQEFDELLKQKEQEMKLAEDELKKAEEEQAEEDEQHEQELASLEEALEEVPENVPENVDYQAPLEQMIPQSLYEFTDYNVYQELKNIQESMQEKGYATQEQQAKLRQFRDQRDAIKDAYTPQEMNTANTQRGQYLQRAESILKDIDDKLYKGE